jgi:hypothetical protein
LTLAAIFALLAFLAALRRSQSSGVPEGIAQLHLAQKFLRILDLLVDMGDRRSAALQLGEAFREIRAAG